MALYFNSNFFGTMIFPRITYSWLINGFAGSGSRIIASDVPFEMGASGCCPYDRLGAQPAGAWIEILSNIFDGVNPSRDFGIIKTSESTFAFYNTPNGEPPTAAATANYEFFNQIGAGDLGTVKFKTKVYWGYTCYNDDETSAPQLTFVIDDGTGEGVQFIRQDVNQWLSVAFPTPSFISCNVQPADIWESALHEPNVNNFQAWRAQRAENALTILNSNILSANGGATSGYPVDYSGADSVADYGGGLWNYDSDSQDSAAGWTSDLLDCDIIKIWQPSKQEMKDLAAYLVSDNFIDNLQKTWSDPMQSIISLALFPVLPTADMITSEVLTLGGVETGITMHRLAGRKTWVKLEFGTINLGEHFGSFQDYTANTDLQIYLPFIGFKQLNVKDYINTQVRVNYFVEFLTGDCLAEIQVVDGKTRNMDYLKGNCMISVPLTSQNYIGAYAGILSTLTNVASGNVQGVFNSVASPKIQTASSGGISGAGGACATMYPYLIIDWQRQVKPMHYNEIKARPLYTGGTVSTYHGLTVGKIECQIPTATEKEKEEIERLFESGVYLL